LVSYTYTFAIADASTVIFNLQNLVNAPDNLASVIANVSAGIPLLILNGIYIPTTCKPIKEFKRLINELLFNQIAPIVPIAEIVEYKNWVDIDAEVGFEAPMIPNYKNRSSYSLQPLTLTNITNILNYLATPPTGPGQLFAALQYVIFGGKVNSVPAKSSVMTARNGTVGWLMLGSYYSNSNAIFQAYDYVNGLYNLILANGGSIFADPNAPDLLLTDYLTSYWGSNVNFLERVKTKVDPNNFFNGPQTIPVI
jgi:hypothetical protein